MREGVVTLHLHNDSETDQLLRLDWAAWRDDAVTAAAVTTRQRFRDLFSSETVAAGTGVDVGHLA
ncbi:MAG: hypothetical protein ACPGID_03835, partial [Rubricella sp.]